MRTDVTVLPTSTPTHHTGSPSCTPKVPVVSCRGSLGGVVVVGAVVGGDVVVVGAVVGGAGSEIGGARGAGVGGTIVPPEVPGFPVAPGPGDTTHCGDAMVPCPTALPSESSTVTSGVVGTIGMIDELEELGALTDPGAPAEDEPAEPAEPEPDEPEPDVPDDVPPVPPSGVGDP
jgi:hypothetical protein